MADPERDKFNRLVLDEFRGNGGQVGGHLEGRPVLILHTIGVRSGAEIARPLMYLHDDDRYVVFGSMGGSPKHPDWYYNVQAEPRVTIEVGTRRLTGRGRIAERDERDELWERQIAAWPQFAEYQSKTERVIPAVIIDVVGDAEPTEETA